MTRKMISIDPYSFSSSKLYLKYFDRNLSTATGFYYSYNNEVYLISNWHVFSGRSRYTGQCIDKTGSVPNRVAILTVPNQSFIDNNPEYEFGAGLSSGIFLGLNNEDGDPVWLQHPVHGQEIDIAALKVDANLLLTRQFEFSNSNIAVLSNAPSVTEDVFIVGYPHGLAVMEYFPIWKRGTIASDFSIDVGFRPIFYVDAKTNEGMSGSPVYLRDNSVSAETKLSSGIIQYNYTQLIGVYSGRMKPKISIDNEEKESLDLGEVWKSHLIDEIIEGCTTGAYKLK